MPLTIQELYHLHLHDPRIRYSRHRSGRYSGASSEPNPRTPIRVGHHANNSIRKKWECSGRRPAESSQGTGCLVPSKWASARWSCPRRWPNRPRLRSIPPLTLRRRHCRTSSDRLIKDKIGPLAKVRSDHYVAIGDAAHGFMRVILQDCEQLARDYLSHFRHHGFAVHAPDGPLIVVMYQDDRSFRKFFRFQGPAGSPIPSGIYERKSNVLHVFDWRNVPMAPRASHRNMQTLSHEGTHQLAFNTGLLRRDGDTPLCIIEGLGTYGEARQTIGASDLGRLNLERMDDLARRQRQIPWIPLRDLLTQDQILRAGSAARVLLAYAQSWLLVHYLIKEPAVSPRFRDYLKAISLRDKPDHRIEDAQAHLGDVNKLDAELRRYAVQIQRSVP